MKMVAPMEIGICCEDLDRQIRFYTEVLGCTLVGTAEVPADKAKAANLAAAGYRVCRLQTPWGERLKFLEPSDPPAVPDRSTHFLDRRNNAYVTFIIDDLEAMMARLRAAGASLTSGAQKVEIRPGIAVCFAADPEGNTLEFVEFADVAAYRPDLPAN